jgi:hypothetical protein
MAKTRWNKKYSCCIKCGTQEKKHRGYGLCSSCYYFKNKEHMLKQAKEWRAKTDYCRKRYLVGKKTQQWARMQLRNLRMYGGNWNRRRIMAGYRCEDCGIGDKQHIEEYKQTLHMHHKDYNKDNNDIENLRCLCSLCHRKYHKVTGEANPASKLTNSQVDEIRANKGNLTPKELAEKYGVGRHYIYDIRNGKARVK